MRIDYLNLRAFGHFTDYNLTFDHNKNLHVIYGPNEAGKSTILRSVMNFLYGFPQQTPDSFMHSNQKLRIEGGVSNTIGEKLAFIRRKGRKNTVLDLNNNPIEGSMLNNFLNELTEQHFAYMFALDHDRLREGGRSLLESEGSLGESLFSAASGVSILNHLFQNLDEKSKALYKKSGSLPKINQVLQHEKDLRNTIMESQLAIYDWKELERKYFEGKQDIEELLNEIRRLSRKKEKLQRIQVALPRIAKRKEYLDQLERLQHVPELPGNIETLRMENLKKLETEKQKLHNAQEKLKELEKQLTSISVPEGILDHGLQIEDLYSDIKVYQANKKSLPVITGEIEILEQKVISLLKEIGDTSGSFQNVENYRLNAAKKKTIKELCKQKPLLDQSLSVKKKAISRMQMDRNSFVEELDELDEIPELEELENAINLLKSEGKIEAMVISKMDQYLEQENSIKDAINSLPLWNGTIQELKDLEIPMMSETIKKNKYIRDDLMQKLDRLNEKIENVMMQKEESQLRIRQLDSMSDIPSEETLYKLRSHREKGWQLIRTTLQKEKINQEEVNLYTKGRPLYIAYEDSVKKADHISDKMRFEAVKIGEKKKLISDIEDCDKKLLKLEADKSNLEAAWKDWEKSWVSLWKAASITPLSPEEMLEWLTFVNEIRSNIQVNEQLQKEIQELKVKIGELKQQLVHSLQPFTNVTTSESMDTLLKKAEKFYKQFKEEQNKHGYIKEKLNEITGNLEKLNREKEEEESLLEDWEAEWEAVIQTLHVPKGTSPNIVEEMLSIYEECVNQYDQVIALKKRREKVIEGIETFENKAEGILTRIKAIQNKEHSIDGTVSELYKIYQQAKHDQLVRDNLRKQFDLEKKNELEAAKEIDITNDILKGLMKKAHCETLEELEKVESLFNQKKEYEKHIRLLEEQLIDYGQGRTIDELILEAEGLNKDSIEIELQETIRHLQELDRNRSIIEQEYGAVKKEYESKVNGHSIATVKAKEERESVLEELRELTNEYINYKLAAILLKKGIECYRNESQSPILTTASGIFSRLTLYSFAGLSVDFNEKDEPILIGIRNTGDKVTIEGMSDGTKDQLYLALRLASIQLYVSKNEAIPFIIDDILIHFDEERSIETLKTLTEFSKSTQVIFFTHHYHLIELMQKVAKDHEYQIISIDSKTPTIV